MYDLIIIGAGTAGISAYKEAIKHTQNLIIINDGPWDTTCARVGCMPSKVLISSANRLYEARTAQQVGLDLSIQFNPQGIMQHVRQLRDRFTTATLKDVNHWPEQHKIQGQAQFVDAQTIEVNNKRYQAKSFIIAVGSTPQINSDDKKLLGKYLISSDDVFELENLPNSMAVIGSGVIAVELAQAFQRLGVKVDVFARSRRVGVLTSPVLQELAQSELSQEIKVHFEVLPTQYEKTTNGVITHYEEQGLPQKIEVDYVLMATGRRSHLDTLKLDNIQSEFTDLKNLPINPNTKQLADLPIFIVGDAHTTTPLQHEAAYEGRTAVHNCLNFPHITSLKTLTPLGIVFTQPEMAIVGQSQKSLKAKSVDFVTGFVDYSRQGRAIVLGMNQGAAEIYIDKHTRQILGAELFTHAAEHLAHLLAWMIDEKVTIDDALNKPYYHPTLQEGLRTALKHARRQLSSDH